MLHLIPLLACCLPLYYWHENKETNFGDYLSLKIVERMVGGPVDVYEKKPVVPGKKLLAIGSIFYFAREGDVVWGSGFSGKQTKKSDYRFENLDVRSVRGPLSRAFLVEQFGIETPEVYGDPALLFPRLFPEFKRALEPKHDYIVIPHYSEQKLFPKNGSVVYPTDPWDLVVREILDSRFVISSSLHGIIIAEAFGIPARFLRVTEHEPLFKYADYYLGTNRPNFRFATSVAEALQMGGEPAVACDLKKLYGAFPFDYWPGAMPLFPQEFVLEAKKFSFEGFEGAFNPSIIHWKGKRLMIFRVRDPVTKNTDDMALVSLDDNWEPIGEPKRLEKQWDYPRAQDPRLVAVGDRLFILFNNVVQESGEMRRMFLAEIQDETIGEPICLNHVDFGKPREKNWVPFDHKGSLKLAYSLNPHIILSEGCETIATSLVDLKWPWGELRGGTPALQVGEEYLAFFHSSKEMLSPYSPTKKISHYFMGAYTFRNEPPFDITRISPTPIIHDDFYAGPAYHTWKPLRVIFPGGFVDEDPYIWVSYGRQDHELWIVKLDKQGLLNSLIPVR